MEVELHEKAKEELETFPDEVKHELKSCLFELEEEPNSHENSGQIQVRDNPVFKYVMKEGGRGGKIDHRAVYDIQNGKVIIYTIFHRDQVYDKDKIARRF